MLISYLAFAFNFVTSLGFFATFAKINKNKDFGGAVVKTVCS